MWQENGFSEWLLGGKKETFCDKMVHLRETFVLFCTLIMCLTPQKSNKMTRKVTTRQHYGCIMELSGAV